MGSDTTPQVEISPPVPERALDRVSIGRVQMAGQRATVQRGTGRSHAVALLVRSSPTEGEIKTPAVPEHHLCTPHPIGQSRGHATVPGPLGSNVYKKEAPSRIPPLHARLPPR